MTNTVNNADSIVWSKDIHQLPEPGILGRDTDVVPVGESGDLRPTVLLELDETMRLPRINVATDDKAALVTVSGSTSIRVPEGEEVERTLGTSEPAYTSESNRRKSQMLRKTLTVRNYGEIPVKK